MSRRSEEEQSDGKRNIDSSNYTSGQCTLTSIQPEQVTLLETHQDIPNCYIPIHGTFFAVGCRGVDLEYLCLFFKNWVKQKSEQMVNREVWPEVFNTIMDGLV